MSDDSDVSSKRNRKKRKPVPIGDSSSDSSVEIVASRKKRRKHKNYIRESDSDSDSSVNIIYRKTRVFRVTSDSDSSTSDDGTNKSNASSSDSEYESDWISETEAAESKPPDPKPQINENEAANSDSSNGESEKCPICLQPFKSQEVGSPESCDHSFCVDCIVEWSKNVNTCPVDRQPFNLILVRKNYDGKVIKQIPVEPATQQNEVDEIVEDPTFCEICGRSDAEDRMLLCDGCDLGFHLECLDPPLQEVPAGVWYCRDCGPELISDDPMIDVYEVHLLLEDAETLGWPTRARRRNHATPRLVPRTRQSERVRARIITRRSRRLDEQQDEAPRSEGVSNQPGPSSSIARDVSSTRNNGTKKRKYKKRKRKPRIKVTYEIDEKTGQKIAIETKIKRKYRRKKRKSRGQRDRARRPAQPKTVKKRLAVQLGMCPPRQVGQTLPDVRIPNNPNTINFQRSQAGIPTLHLFGRRNELDYFSQSDSDGDVNEGVNVLIRRRPHPSEAALLRRAVRRKAVISGPVSSPPNILDTILDSQSKLHSKNSVMSLNKDGTVKIDKNDAANNNRRLENNRNLNVDSRDLSSDRSRVNLNSFNSSFRQTPMYGNGDRNNTNPMYMSPNNYNRTLSSENLDAVTTSSGGAASHNQGPDEDESEQSYSVQPACSSYDSESDSKKDKDKEKSRSGTPGTHSDSELDIYSDIETVSTSRAEESDIRPSTPPQAATPNTLTDEDGNNSDVDLVIDTEKVDDKFDDSKELVTSTVDLAIPVPTLESNSSQAPHSTSDIQNEMVHSSDNKMGVGKEVDKDDDDDSEDGCPNFSIYSTESINLAKTTDLQLLSDSPMVPMNDDNEVGSSKTSDQTVVQSESEVKEKKEKNHGGLYSDDEDETLIKIDHKVCEMETVSEHAPNEDKSNEKPFGIGDISNMTEDISEEERSYTPCLDERALSQKQGLEGLDTELISDEERNDFDESHELKMASDGDALEINAKESELDFSKPEDYEEGEIVDKLKAKKAEEIKKATEKEEEKPDDKKENKENENLSFKKLSKNSKERNYRDKDKEKERDRSKSKEKKERDRDKENRKERKKEKRKEIERYNVRSIIAEKPRRMKDKFGRDEQRKRSVSRSKSSRSPSFTRRSCSRERRTVSRERVKFRGRSRTRRSLSRSKSPEKRRSRSKIKKHRSLSRDKAKPRRKSGTVAKHKRKDSRSRHKSMSPRRRRDWVGRRQSRGWSRSTHSYTPEQRLTPSWTPPRVMQPQPVVKPHNLTVILNNDINKKKKEKKKKLEKRKEIEKAKKRRREKTPPPSKEVFASGNNILVSVSFNKDTNERDVTKRKRTATDEITTKRTRKEKEKRKSDERRKKKNKDLAGIKPVAIIDLERSPFREITPSPDDIIVLSDSENCESNDMMGLQKVMCDSSQQVASPERSVNTSYLTGPKTPPEPQVKFILNAQQPKIRAISNPLHEPDDVEVEIDPQEELEQRLNDTLHKGPNTPPEPPISPPSSPDAYDPFDPTKSRSPTPQPLSQTVQSSTSQNDVTRDDVMDSRNDDDEIVNTKSHTPPVIADIQPADSQSNIKATTPEKSPEHTISVIINQVVQSQASIFPTVTSKPSYSTNALITSTPINLTAPRINILNSTILTPPNVASAVPQRIVLPNTTKSSPVKVSPNKLPIKSTPIKPMPAKNIVKSKPSRKSNEKEIIDVTLDFDSPYSPGSNDYEDLFEPPSDNIKISSKPSKNTKSPTKGQSTFDVLFGSSPVNNLFKNKGKAKPTKYKKNSKGTKQVGVKIDEDTLKILDELPNSAVEMQVKDKFVDEWVLSHGPASCNTEKLQYLKKLNRQERVVEEVKLVLKPHYNKKHINKEEYKDILRRSVPKICHNKSGEINPKKIQNLIEAYVKKVRHSKKVTSSSSVNPQKV